MFLFYFILFYFKLGFLFCWSLAMGPSALRCSTDPTKRKGTPGVVFGWFSLKVKSIYSYKGLVFKQSQSIQSSKYPLVLWGCSQLTTHSQSPFCQNAWVHKSHVTLFIWPWDIRWTQNQSDTAHISINCNRH